MTEEEKIFAGQLFCPGHPELKALKLRSHNLCALYNRLFEDEEERNGEEKTASEIAGEAEISVPGGGGDAGLDIASE